MDVKNVTITEDNLKAFIENLQKAVGNKEKINELLDNHELVIAYLKKIGVNPEWLDKMLAVECMKAGLSSILLYKDAVVSEKGVRTSQYSFEVENGILYTNRYVNDSFKKGIREIGNGEDLEFFDENIWERGDRIIIDSNGVMKESESNFQDVMYLKRRVDGKRHIKEERYHVNKNGETTLENTSEYDVIPGYDAIELIKMLRRFPKYRKWFEEAGYSLEELREYNEREFKEIEEKDIFSEEKVSVLKEAIEWQKREATIRDVAYSLEKSGLLNRLIERMNYEIDVDCTDYIEKRNAARIVRGLKSVGIDMLVPKGSVVFNSKEDLVRQAEKDVDKKIEDGVYGITDITEAERALLVSETSLKLIQNQEKGVSFAFNHPSRKKLLKNQAECLKYMYRAYTSIPKEEKEKMKNESKMEIILGE